MTSMGSSEISVCKDQRIVQHSSTPRTSTSSPEAGGNGQPRRSPSVRFTKGKGLADDIEHLPSLTLKDANSLQPGQDASGKDSKSYVEVLEDRVNDLENRLQSLEFSRLLDSSDKGDESSERSFLNTEPHWMTWQEYLEPTSKASNILEVLIEKPHTNARRRSAAPQALPEAFGKVPGQPLPDAIKKIERIRIRSPHIISALQTITEQTFTNSSCLTVHRPFKLFIFYGNHIEDYVSELEFDFNKSSYCAHGERCKGSINLDGTPPRSRDDNHQGDSQRGPIEKLLTLQDRDISGQNRAGEVHRHPASVEGKAEAGTITQSRQPRSEQRTLPEDFNDYECKHEISEELLAQKESIVHLRALLSFMKEDMREIFNRHQLLRSSQSSTVAWIDLWHLFMVGDFVVSDRVSNSKTASLYRVAILPACDFTSSGRRTVKELKMRSDGPQQQVESVYGQESLSAFDIDLYYFDFDGKNYGCVEKRITIVNFEGKKKITDLPVYPLRFHNDPAAFKLEMLEKGNKFLGLSTTVTAHREYTGLSLAEPQEQVSFPERKHYNLMTKLTRCKS